MLSENRMFHAIGRLKISKSRSLESSNSPKDDKVNWLFLCVNNEQFSFVYQIDDPSTANYDSPFEVKMAFTVDYDIIKNFILERNAYDVLRGKERVGSVEIINFL